MSRNSDRVPAKSITAAPLKQPNASRYKIHMSEVDAVVIGGELYGPITRFGRTMLNTPIRKQPPSNTSPSPPTMIAAPAHPRAAGRGSSCAYGRAVIGSIEAF